MASTILICFLIYTLLLFVVMWLTSRRAGNDAFFRAGRRSPWFVIAYGMIGASLSGVTFMSVPGGVYSGQFTYLPLVFGYVVGYAVIAWVLLPLYYRLNVTSIYSYLEQRFGSRSEKTGAIFFIISRLMGSALRLYLVVFVLYEFVFREWGIPFWVPAVVFVAIILLYTFRGGLKTVVWTDTLQTTFLLLAAIITVVAILRRLDISWLGLMQQASDAGYTKVFDTDITHGKYYWKQIVSGAFITITMTGLDQDMMQKNLTCRTLREAQKDMCSYGVAFVPVNLLFLSLGVLLTRWYQQQGIATPAAPDDLLPQYISLTAHLTPLTAVFVLGIVAASFSTADSALTSMTTSYCVDIRRQPADESLRKRVHLIMCLVFALFIQLFRLVNSTSLIDAIYIMVGYTYGPLLGLFAFGLFTRRQPADRLVPYICVASPLLCYVAEFLARRLWNYHFGYELLMLNGLLTFAGLWISSRYTRSAGCQTPS